MKAGMKAGFSKTWIQARITVDVLIFSFNLVLNFIGGRYAMIKYSIPKQIQRIELTVKCLK